VPYDFVVCDVRGFECHADSIAFPPEPAGNHVADPQLLACLMGIRFLAGELLRHAERPDIQGRRVAERVNDLVG